MRRSFALSGVLSIGLMLALPAAAAKPLYRSFKDFVVGCDNVQSCHAEGLAEEPGGENPLVLELWRDAGPEGKGVLSLGAGQKFSPKALQVDGKAAPELSALPWREDDGDAECAWRLEDPAAIARFLAAVRNAKRVTVGAGESQSSLSLNGLSATLLLIDDTQGRLGTQTAWLRVGPKPASAVPPAPAVPVLASAPKPGTPLTAAQAKALGAKLRKAQAQALRHEECDVDPANLPPDEAFALGAHEALVLLGCNMGAYNEGYLAFRTPRDGAGASKRLVLEVPQTEKTDPTTMSNFTAPSYDPGTGTFSQFDKGRGIGDCGVSASWRFDGERFVLSAYAMLDRCGGVAPGDFVTLYRTK